MRGSGKWLVWAALLVAVSSALAAEAPASVDLSQQFPADPTGQGHAGTCHDFAAIALLEAAYWRGSGHQTLLLSPADLFIRGSLLYPSSMASDYVRNGIESAYLVRRGKKEEYNHGVGDLDEGDSPTLDIAYVLTHGVATQEILPYWSFYSRYRDVFLPALKDRLAAAERLAGVDQLDVGSAEAVRRRRAIAEETITPAIHAFVGDVDRRFPGLESSRDKTLRVLKSLGADSVYWTFESSFDVGGSKRDGYRLAPAECEQKGSADDRAYIIRRLLDHGLPVGVSMALRGIAEWNEDKPTEVRPLDDQRLRADVAAQADANGWRQAHPDDGAWHTFVLTGYQVGPDGRLVFRTRNSWGEGAWNDARNAPVGDTNYPVRADELCRISDAYIVYVAADHFDPKKLDSADR